MNYFLDFLGDTRGKTYQTAPTQPIKIPPITSRGVWTRATTLPTATRIVNTKAAMAIFLCLAPNQIASTIAIVNSAWSDGNPGLFKKDAPASTPINSNGRIVEG